MSAEPPDRFPTRRSVLAGLFFGVGTAAFGGAPATSLRPRPRPTQAAAAETLRRVVEGAGIRGEITAAVADARSGKILESVSPERRLPPASVAKAITALYAIEHLGLGHRFRTSLVATGPLENGKLKGDLILVGGGDPVLDTDRLAALAKGLKAAGVVEVEGAFRLDTRALPSLDLIDPKQPDHVGYNPGVGALNLNFNRVHFEWKRSASGYAVTMDARTANYRPEVGMARMQIVDRGAPVYTYAAGDGVDAWTVARGALGREGSRWLPVRHPEHYAADVFRTLARSHGIVLSPPKPGLRRYSGTQLAAVESPPLAEILVDMLRWSTNLTAEVVGLAATHARGRQVTSLKASGAEMARWAKARYGLKTPYFVDHSGLGDASRITVTDMVRALAAAGADSPLNGLMKTVKLKDAQGTPIQSKSVEIRAKTGTLNFVSGLAGYVNTDDRALAFAIFEADLNTRRGLSKAERERPAGAKSWVNRARRVQQTLLRRWVRTYGTS